MAEGEPGAALVPVVAAGAWVSVPPDWRRLYEEARERAEAAEARAEELKQAALDARSAAGGWRWQFEEARRKRLLALEEAKEARCTAKDALSLKAEVGRLRQLLAEAGVESGRWRPVALRREVARLRKAVPGAEVQARKIRELHRALPKEHARLRRRVKCSSPRGPTGQAERGDRRQRGTRRRCGHAASHGSTPSVPGAGQCTPTVPCFPNRFIAGSPEKRRTARPHR